MSDSQEQDGEQTKSIIKNHIIQEFMYDKPEATLSDDTLLVEAGIISSLGVVRLITFLEEQFDFQIEPEDIVLEHFETVNAIFGLLSSKNNA